MRIAGTLPCSLVNGDGIRFVIFTQGCGHHCKGCQNPDTWDFNGGTEMSVEQLAEQIKAKKHIDGITLSGGDPFYQQDECVKLLKLLPNINVWVYTGFSYNDIKDTPLAQMCDVIVDGMYVEELKCTGKMYGSSNQNIIRRR
jgi:anaerobic ribonucleoside-triphosphate reductase activating protein